MYVYKCPECGKQQYSSSNAKAGENCIYCGNKTTELLGTWDSKGEYLRRRHANETIQGSVIKEALKGIK